MTAAGRNPEPRLTPCKPALVQLNIVTSAHATRISRHASLCAAFTIGPGTDVSTAVAVGSLAVAGETLNVNRKFQHKSYL